MAGQYTVKPEHEAVAVELDGDQIHITLRNGQVKSMPISFFSWLDRATPDQRNNYEVLPQLVYWPDLEEGIDMYAYVNDSWARKRDVSQVG